MASETRYRPLGIGPASANFSGFSGYAPEAEQAYRGMGSLNARMAQLSQSVFGMAEDAMKEEGANYGAQNAPTEEQIQSAREAGLPVVLPGQGDSSVRGKAAFKTASAVASDRMEMLARKEIADLTYQAKVEDWKPDRLATQLNAVTEGYAKALAEQNPVAAVKLKAQVALIGNTHWENYTTTWVGREREKAKAVDMMGVDGIIDGVKELVQRGGRDVAQVGADGKVSGWTRMSLNDALDNEKFNIRKKMVGRFSATEIEAAITRFDKEADLQKLGAVTDWARDPRFVGNASKAYNMLITGKIDDPRVSEIWQSLDPAQRVKARDGIFGLMRDQSTLERTEQQNQEHNADMASRRIEAEIAIEKMDLVDGKPGAQQRIDDLMGKYKALNPRGYATELGKQASEPGLNNPYAERNLRRRVANGQASLIDIETAPIGEKERESIRNTFVARQDKDFKAADDDLAKLMKRPPPTLVNQTQADRARQLEYDALSSKLTQAKLDHKRQTEEYLAAVQAGRKDVPNPGRFDAFAWVQKAHDEWKKGEGMAKQKRFMDDLGKINPELQDRTKFNAIINNPDEQRRLKLNSTMIENAKKLWENLDGLAEIYR